MDDKQIHEDIDQEDTHQGEYASAEEATAAVRALTDEEIMKLMIAAEYYWNRRYLRDLVSAQELLGEAVLRTLDGRRRWRRSQVSLMYHLDRSMESISGHTVGQLQAEKEMLAETSARRMETEEAEQLPFERPVAEARLVAEAELTEIGALFADAPDALAVLRLKAKGYSESEIRNVLGMEKRRYEAARKKLERELAKYVFRSKGLQS